MITFGKVVTDDEFRVGLAAVKDFVSQRGPHHGITDFSQVERNVSTTLIHPGSSFRLGTAGLGSVS